MTYVRHKFFSIASGQYCIEPKDFIQKNMRYFRGYMSVLIYQINAAKLNFLIVVTFFLLCFDANPERSQSIYIIATILLWVP